MFINFASYSFYFFNLSVNVCLSSSASNMHSSFNKVEGSGFLFSSFLQRMHLLLSA